MSLCGAGPLETSKPLDITKMGGFAKDWLSSSLSFLHLFPASGSTLREGFISGTGGVRHDLKTSLENILPGITK